MNIQNEEMDGKKIILAAHRGDQTHCPENTMAAFRAANALGCDMIETDIHMTADGQLVIMHDRDVRRTTNGSGFIDGMTMEQVRGMDAGSWKSREFAGERVPAVEEFLDFVEKTSMQVNWEIKEYPDEVGEQHAFACVDKLVELIERCGMTRRSMVNSFSARVLEYVADNYPGKFVIHGQGINTSSKQRDRSSKPVESFLDWVCMYGRSEENPAGRKEDYDYAIARGIIPCICFADTEENYRQAISLGCRMFTSNDPEKGIEILRKLGER